MSADEPLRAGAAEVEITPPLDFLMAGYYHERRATGVVDPLKAKALVFRGNGQAAALVVCDLTGIARDLAVEVRGRAEQATGIPAKNIAITATHSHTAPDYSKDLYDYLGKEAASGDMPYAARLIAGIVDAIRQADAALQPAAIAAGSARQETPVSFNRRFVMKDGSVRTWMSLDNPEVVRPAGPIDPEIGLVVVRSAAEQPLAVLSNFALHLDTVGGTQWSADYPYYIEQAVRKSLGPQTVSLFGTGCCGDINHSDPSRKERNKTDFIGNSLGATIQAALPQLSGVPQPRLQVFSQTVPLPLAEVSAEQVARAETLLPSVKAGTQADFFDVVIAYKSIMLDQLRNATPRTDTARHINWGLSRTWAGVGGELPVDVQVIALGRDVAIVCLPGEVFVELGLAIKQASPFRTTLVVELANCVETAYIPTRAAYAGGSYEVTNSAVQAGAGEMLVEAALRLLREAAAQPAP